MKYIWLILALTAIAAVCFFCYRQTLKSFYASSQRAFPVPGLDTRFDEQGITYDAPSGLFLFSGYMKDRTASAVYLVDPKNGETVKKISLLTADGDDFTGHAGGVAVSGKYVYIAGSTDDCVYVYDRESILKGETAVRCLGVFPLSTSKEDGVRASFLASSDDGILYVGEFHYDLIPQLHSRENHTFGSGRGKTNALLVGFRINAEEPLGLEPTPCIAYRIPDKAQGAAIHDGTLTVSQAFGLSASSIISYSLSERTETAELELLGASVPVFGLPEPHAKLRAIPLTEGIVEVDGRLYFSSELANVFPKKLWRLIGCDLCFSIDAK